MGEEVTTDNALVKLKIVSFISLIAFIVSLTFSLTTIYNRFIYVEDKLDNLERVVDEKDFKTNDRLDKKTKRNTERIEILENEINK